MPGGTRLTHFNFGNGYFNNSPFAKNTLSITVNPGAVLRTTPSHALDGDSIDAGNSLGQILLLGGEYNLPGAQVRGVGVRWHARSTQLAKLRYFAAA